MLDFRNYNTAQQANGNAAAAAESGTTATPAAAAPSEASEPDAKATALSEARAAALRETGWSVEGVDNREQVINAYSNSSG